MLFLRAAHHLIWNQFTKSRADAGGNIALGLDLEFKNKMVKQSIKKLGVSATWQVIRQDMPLPYHDCQLKVSLSQHHVCLQEVWTT